MLLSRAQGPATYATVVSSPHLPAHAQPFIVPCFGASGPSSATNHQSPSTPPVNNSTNRRRTLKASPNQTLGTRTPVRIPQTETERETTLIVSMWKERPRNTSEAIWWADLGQGFHVLTRARGRRNGRASGDEARKNTKKVNIGKKEKSDVQFGRQRRVLNCADRPTRA